MPAYSSNKSGMKNKPKNRAQDQIPCSRCPSPSSCRRAGKCLAKAMS